MDLLQKILIHFELHSTEGIQDCLQQGLDPNLLVDGKPLIYQLINMYARGPQFKRCIETMVNNGAIFEDKALLSVLMDDASSLRSILENEPKNISKTYTLQCTFTPLIEASLLHICAEYDHVSCALVLLEYGADVNCMAGTDEYGFGKQTPIFHTVNQDSNKSIDMLKLLLLHKADLHFTVAGLIWGKGYEWETFIPGVNPISYAMMGLLRQFQRNESDIYEIVRLLMEAKYGIDYKPSNIPNRYLGS